MATRGNSVNNIETVETVFIKQDQEKVNFSYIEVTGCLSEASAGLIWFTFTVYRIRMVYNFYERG